MELLLSAIGVILAGGVLAGIAGKQSTLASLLGAGGVVVGSVLGLIPVVRLLGGAEPPLPLELPWEHALGRLVLAIDPLSAIFALPILVLCPLAAVYGVEYLREAGEKKSLGPTWFFYSVLTASMLALVLSRNGFLFLLCWEAMSVSSYFLVTFDDEEEEVRQAGWIYLVATHIGTAFLLVLFLLWGNVTGSLDFLVGSEQVTPVWASVFLVLGLIGFGAKAGLMPLHVWLPEAHPAAPSHVSAVMSGVMIKMGIYGIVRTMALVGHPQEWWAWLLIGIGCASGIIGVIFALAQHDLKRLLAYSSVENIGIITIGLGIGILGLRLDNRLIEAVGFGGAFLHVWNHTLFKGLLFLGAGSVLHGAGTRRIDHLGGLLKRMPWTGCCFLLGACAICGLPPLNGFASEFLLYFGAFKEEIRGGATAGALSTPGHAIPALIIIGSLALIGGLSALTFTKAVGISFLGEPRTQEAADAHESGIWMWLPMVALAICCAAVGLLSPAVDQWLAPGIVEISKHTVDEMSNSLNQATSSLGMVSLMAAILLGLFIGLVALRAWLLAEREVGESVTWDCGYAKPEVTMQYTGASFAQPAMEIFAGVLRTEVEVTPPTELFPQSRPFASQTPDLAQTSLFTPLFETFGAMLSWWRWVQHGRLNLYIFAIAATLMVLLAVVVSGLYDMLVANWKEWLRSWNLGG